MCSGIRAYSCTHGHQGTSGARYQGMCILAPTLQWPELSRQLRRSVRLHRNHNPRHGPVDPHRTVPAARWVRQLGTLRQLPTFLEIWQLSCDGCGAFGAASWVQGGCALRLASRCLVMRRENFLLKYMDRADSTVGFPRSLYVCDINWLMNSK